VRTALNATGSSLPRSRRVGVFGYGTLYGTPENFGFTYTEQLCQSGPLALGLSDPNTKCLTFAEPDLYVRRLRFSILSKDMRSSANTRTVDSSPRFLTASPRTRKKSAGATCRESTKTCVRPMLQMCSKSPKTMPRSASIEHGRCYERVFTRVLAWKEKSIQFSCLAVRSSG